MTIKKPLAQRPFRALMQFDSLPQGHATFWITDDGSAPHLKEREYAVIDKTDRELQHGELYLLQFRSGPRSRRIFRVRTSMAKITPAGPKQPVWWYSDAAGWRRDGTTMGDIPVFSGLSEGPFRAEKLQDMIVGRVVGFAEQSFGALIEPTAGWENEDAGNAAFDPAEYLDTLIRTGHRPYLAFFGGGAPFYIEMMPERALTDEEDAAVMAVRWKYVRASLAHDRVVAECGKRGLVEVTS